MNLISCALQGGVTPRSHAESVKAAAIIVFLSLAIVSGLLVFLPAPGPTPLILHVVFILSVVAFLIATVKAIAESASRDVEAGADREPAARGRAGGAEQRVDVGVRSGGTRSREKTEAMESRALSDHVMH